MNKKHEPILESNRFAVRADPYAEVGFAGGMNRRQALELIALGATGAGLAAVTGCDPSAGAARKRRFFVSNTLRWSRSDLFTDFAFAITQYGGEQVMDYLDIRSRQAKAAFRVFLYSVDIASTFLVTCPGCAIGVRVGLTVSKILWSELANYGFRQAVAFAQGGGHDVHKVGPAETRFGYLEVQRAELAYDVRNREPVGSFNREIPAVPSIIFNWTELSGFQRDGYVDHVWRRDGAVTDRIRQGVQRSRSWRSWSFKRNLAPGTWIVTTEAPAGEILASREFHIAA